MLISATSLFIHILSKTSSFCWFLGSWRKVTSKQSEISGREFISSLCQVWKWISRDALSLCSFLALLLFQNALCPDQRVEKWFIVWTYVDFLTNFALGCVNSIVGAYEILFQKEKFSLSSFDVIDCRNHWFAIVVSKISTQCTFVTGMGQTGPTISLKRLIMCNIAVIGEHVQEYWRLFRNYSSIRNKKFFCGIEFQQIYKRRCPNNPWFSFLLSRVLFWSKTIIPFRCQIKNSANYAPTMLQLRNLRSPMQNLSKNLRRSKR